MVESLLGNICFFFPVEFDNVFFGDMVSKNIFAPVVCACIGNNFY
jgi:hypothetical protein